MARYIDADEVYEIAKTEHKDFVRSIADLTSIRELLEDTPAADVVKVKHGYWIEGKTLEKCSVCGKKGFPDWYYCPHCGAKMDDTPKERGGRSERNNPMGTV